MISRRQLLASSASAAAAAAAPLIDRAVIENHDKGVEYYLKNQVVDPNSRCRGAIPDAFGLHNPGTAAGCLEAFLTAFLQPSSKFHRSPELMARMRLAIGHLERERTASGNYNLYITNFDSPPDTAFITRSTATSALLAQRHGLREITAALEPVLRTAGAALAAGGVHTPNHRWVVCAALAQLDEVAPHPSYRRRIDQWLAEGIDIDEDGQYSERSTLTYNAVIDSALVVLADKLKRPELLDPARRNLESLLYLLHPGHEAVTDISHRQDQYLRAKPFGSWFPLRYLAVRDGNGQFAALADQLTPSLGALMEYPQLNDPGPRRAPLPDDYEKVFPAVGIGRIRRAKTSATVLLQGNSRFLTVRRGDAIIHAVRMASAFFGKGQFVPSRGERREDGYHLGQSLDAGYYQPFDPPRRVPAGEHQWYQMRPGRRRTEVSTLEQSAVISETRSGLRLRLRTHGARDVPVAVEINLAEGGALEGCVAAPQVKDAWILAEGEAVYRAGADTIRFGPGLRAHSYTQVRGAQSKLAGPSVYLCGYTPFDHTIEFDWDA